MNDRSLSHSTFTIERDYKASAAKIFHAFADPQTKARWFDAPTDEWCPISSAHDFREGGREHSESQFGQDGPVSRFDAYYHEIVPDTRFVYSYEMRVDSTRLSVSLTSIELTPVEGGTRLTLTEQGVYFDGLDNTPERERGTREMLDVLAAVVED
ncbi:SRPBCC family protein [Actinopolymorpha singaporensis]|uniref:Uncharacterized conserved protein YndB, AHSA1/START domain n=1 Tax=Actinopolymorpha singaporensis TaxID=117157 RepID=A0A1H1VXK2_9ACTN|nr:SRPBCC family protein [Actinopolymorpha singaporensis]SDS89465.1 Uncharacterized conserved protein YndB, AHSA1/START domain [Actinopolymorpha singaporensis]